MENPLLEQLLRPFIGLIALVCLGAQVQRCSAQQAKLRATLETHGKTVTCVAFSPDGSMLACSVNDGKIQLWDPTTAKMLRSFHHSVVLSVAFSPDGKTLASGGGRWKASDVELWDMGTAKLRATLKVNTDYPIASVKYSPDGKILASASERDPIDLWDVASGKAKAYFGQGGVKSLAFSPDGRTLAAGGSSQMSLWDVGTFKEKNTDRLFHWGDIWAVAFRPDGKEVACGCDDGTIVLLNVDTGKVRATLKAHKRAAFAVAFSIDGKMLASGGGWDKKGGGWDKNIKLWDVVTGAERATFTGHRAGVDSLAFSPDGKTLASGSFDTTIKLWDLASVGKSRPNALVPDRQ